MNTFVKNNSLLISSKKTLLVEYDMVLVDNPGNTADSTGYGSVAYNFLIAKNSVTIGQYAEFLNAVAKSDPRTLWNANMNNDQRIRGIERTGSDGSYVYTVIGPNGTNPVGAQSAANRPIAYVSWFDAARFANWMSNGKVLNPADATAALALIDNGAYNLGSATTGNAVAKNLINPNTGAAPTFYIPTENEWYKAAYYSPIKNAGSPGYYVYGTQSDAAPGNGWDGTTALANKDSANQTNYRPDNRYTVTGTTATIGVSDNQNLLTDVGAFSGSGSFYGTFDQSGNVYQWNDLDGLASSGSSRGRRGGNWFNDAFYLSSSFRSTFVPSFANGSLGFRLSSPSNS